jgi:hypothetical protein
MIQLKVFGHGHIKGLKNNKLIAKGRLITNKDAWQQQKLIVQDLESQLLSAFQISENETSITRGQLLEIVSLVPCDDCWTDIGDLNLIWNKVPKGKEGVWLYIERVDENSEYKIVDDGSLNIE